MIQSFKGDLKAGEKIVFHDWLEYSPNWKKARAETLLVFLKRDTNAQEFKTIGEAAVFPYNSELVKMVNNIVGESQ